MDHRVESLTVLLLSVRDDVSELERRLSALERSHRSLCKSHMELEDSHASLNSSYQMVLRRTVQLFDDFFRYLSGSTAPSVLRFVIHDCDLEGDVDGVAA
jgi:hypothetical protein